jgi:hypothetical protein
MEIRKRTRMELLLDCLTVYEFRTGPKGAGLKTAIRARDLGWVEIRMDGRRAVYQLTHLGWMARRGTKGWNEKPT